MPPKRRSNNTKKRRPRPDHTSPGPTPSDSPSKHDSANTHSTPGQQPHHSFAATTSKPTSNGPSQSPHHHTDFDHPPDSSKPSPSPSAQKNTLLHPPTKDNNSPSVVTSLVSNADSATLTERSINLPNSSSNHHHPNHSNEAGRPSKSNKEQNSKQASVAHRTQDSGGHGENQINPGVSAKSETKRNHHSLNKSSTHNTSDDSKPATQHQSSETIAFGATHPPSQTQADLSQNGISNESSKKKSEVGESEGVSVKQDNETANSPRNSTKKPAKHVKFTNSKLGPSPHTSTPKGQNHRKQNRPDIEDQADSPTQNKPVRREMSGAADQFDFDAQQRLFAGPGGGMVKKPRHRRPNGGQSTHDASADESNEISSETASVPYQQSTHPRKDSTGYKHAQRCLQSVIEAQHLEQPADLDPDLLQIYLSYFDLNQDGLLDPLDTWSAFRRLGFGLLWATGATIALHVLITPFIGIGSWLMPDIVGRCHLPLGSHLSRSSRNLIHIDPHNLSSLDKENTPDKVGPSALWKKTQEHMGAAEMTDPIGWLKFVIGWFVAVGLTWPSDLGVKPELINGLYNGEILFLVAQDLSS
ncbi:hypothetical protein VP01_756g6 [Puccinia sorghi]|uniref:EF-hand domain-containing protein n=1 Tax=Puccinia sorghi TaxID=27349 RepID=A0A0L6UBZ9_9BASI|nr:hypothetical protein VP01_756g6 [Puccinia sorghi]